MPDIGLFVAASVLLAIAPGPDVIYVLTRGVSLQSEDAWKPLRYVLSARILDPQFQGQTKERLSSRESVKLIASRVKDPLDAWLNQNVEEGKKIINDSGLNVIAANDLSDGAEKIVKAVRDAA